MKLDERVEAADSRHRSVVAGADVPIRGYLSRPPDPTGSRERKTTKRRARSLVWKIYLVLGSLAALAFFLVSGFEHGFAYDLFYDFVGLSAIVAILVGVRMNRPELPLPWHLFALGQVLFVAGDMALNYYENILHVEAPFPSMSDAFWISGYPILAIALLMLIRSRAPGRDWAGLIDATILATSVGVASWVFLMASYAHDPTLSGIEKMISMIYPAMDVMLLAVAARMMVAPGARTVSYRLIGFSLLFLLVADTIYAKMLLDGTYFTGSLPDFWFLLSYVFWGAAALHPAMKTLSEPAPDRKTKITKMRLALLAVASITAPAIRGIQLIRDVEVDRPVIVGGSIVLALLVFARLVLLLRDHERTEARERTLRKSGAELVAAPGRDGIYSAALKAVLELAGNSSGSRASVVAGSAEEMRVMSSAGDGAEEAEGARILVRDLPEELRSALLGERAGVTVYGNPGSLSTFLGFEPRSRAIFVSPLLADGESASALVVDTDVVLPDEFKYGLDSLSSQVALALESETLAENLHKRKSEERFRSLVQNASDLILILGPDGDIRYTSPSVEKVLGRVDEEVVGVNFFDWVHARDAARMLNTMSGCVDNPEVAQTVELRVSHTDGSWRLIELFGTNMLDEPTVEGIVFNARDITERKEAEEAMREAEFRFRTLVEQMPAVTYINPTDAGSNSLYISPQIKNLIGYTVEEGKEDPELWDRALHPDDQERVTAEEAQANADGAPFGTEYRLIAKDDRIVWIRDESILVSDDEGEPQYWQGFMWDISDRKEAEEALREAETKYRALVEQVPAIIYIQEFGGMERMRYLSPQFETVFGYSIDERMEDAEHWIRMVHPDDRELVLAEYERTNQTGHPFRMEYRQIAKDGRVIWIRDEGVLLRDSDGQPKFWQGVMLDVTERKGLEEQLSHQAFHDSLTGLPNRALFMDRLEHALARIERQEGEISVLFLDLDEFKVVNDSLGHKAGDQLLVEVAERLLDCVRPGDTVSRLGGDEFTLLLEGVGNTGEAISVAERISEKLRAPFVIEGHEVFVSTSVGICMGASGQDISEHFLRDADIAMYEAKNKGKSRYEVFTPDMNERALERLQLESEMRRALENNEFRVFYQPLMDLDTSTMREVEALVRWDHPVRGLISPDNFIPLAEKTGLIVPLGEWILREACRQVKSWQEDLGSPSLVLSVNLSPKQFQHPEMVEDIRRVLGETGLDPRSLKLEITEGVIMDDAESTVTILQTLRDLGIQLAIDDFGTGYSSLSYLKRFPVNVLKIDRSFVSGVGRVAEDMAVVRATVAFAKSMGLSVTVEGIETSEQLSFVQALGCDLGQGFYFSRPLPGDAVSRLLGNSLPTSPERGERELLELMDRDAETVGSV